MKLYSNCCLQRDYAVELLDNKKPDAAEAFLRDWPSTIGAPKIPQLLFEIPTEPKQKKRSVALMSLTYYKIQMYLIFTLQLGNCPAYFFRPRYKNHALTKSD